MASANQKTALISYHGGELLVEKSFRRFQVIDVFCKQNQFVNFKPFSSSTKPESIGWEVSSHAVLLRKLEVSLEYHQVDEAWVTFNDFKSLYGFPRDSLVSRLITELSYSSDPHWLQKACTLVLEILKEKSSLLKTEILTKLALSLARAQMPIPASIILRVMLERENMPPVSVLQLIVLHMVKSEIGTYLASNFLIQICDYVLHLSEKRSELKKMMKPDTMIFNLVLDACVREEMQKPYLVSIGSQNLRAGLKIQIVPELLQKDSVIKVEDKTELVIFKNGKLLPTNRTLAKLIHCYKRDQRIAKLSKVLLSMQKDFQTLGESNLCSDVIDACIRLGWLETAHDVLEDTEAAGFPVGLTAYMSLLTAYYSQGMFKEAEALLRQIRKAGLVSNLSGEIVASAGLLETTGNMSSSVSESDLADFLVEEVREEEKVIPSMIYKLNASIYFFCKAKIDGGCSEDIPKNANDGNPTHSANFFLSNIWIFFSGKVSRYYSLMGGHQEEHEEQEYSAEQGPI
ncbi:hypothetical protein GH714_016602 [Hevea brasiliensis]|uniref:At1g68980-like TPR repeats domain-containing protein n=1 Tax=Hevea brasiliensis TaxID=3981 RepID=A0A6A6MEB8_HEVBR|nr:hypothetical protein GH714_016602 [Hevea brasiliensis]